MLGTKEATWNTKATKIMASDCLANINAVSQTYKRGLQELENIGVNLIKTKEVLTTLAKC
ncbi:MAG: hypothetical protein A2Z75_06235 [Chloroflexi bacterium RBG_13_50_10]|nr:MAG: hypothetical protein A2Z75_06235 [Chloroflexi bacterium RBG_13_50_10]